MTNLDWYFNVFRNYDELFIRGFRDGKEVMERVPYEPTLYVEHTNDYGYSNIYGKQLKPIHFNTMKEADYFADQHKDSNLNIYGNPYYASQYCTEHFPDNATKWNKDNIRVFNIDIEVTSTEGFPKPEDAAYPITAICIHDSVADKFVTFGFKESDNWSSENSVLEKDLLDKVVYINCRDEKELVTKFLQYWTTFPPHIITGWNIDGFDMPYIYNRLNYLGFDTRKLSPWKKVSIRQAKTQRGLEDRVVMRGVSCIDYMEVYKKNKVQDSYRLDNIATIELGEKKLDYSEVSGLHNLYFENFQKFIDYNIQDVNLVKRIDEKMGLIDAQIMIAFTSLLNLDEVHGTVRIWDALISNELHKENKIIPFHLNNAGAGGSIPGGHVKEPHLGKHGWCCSFDLNSLYPHLIMQYNISPETLNENYRFLPNDSIEQRIHKLLNGIEITNAPPNHSISCAGYAFDNSFQGVMPRLMKRLYQERKAIKKEMIAKRQRGENADLEDLGQLVRKLLLNSGYGALTNKYYRWYDKRLGEAITTSGQYAIQRSQDEINKWMNKVLGTSNKDYVIAIDTDSNYVTLQPMVDKFFKDKPTEELVEILDKVCQEQIAKVIANGYDDDAKYLNCFEQAMFMEREAIASSAVWTAKKRYAMLVHDMEGVRYEKPKLKIQGLEAIRSSTPSSCRAPLLNIIEDILTKPEAEIQQKIAEFKEEFMKLPIEDIAFPRSINNLRKYTQPDGYMKGTPPHVRGAILHNRLLEKHGITYDYEALKEGEKAKFVYLRQPNNVGTDVISFGQLLPKEFQIEKYVNRNKMFEKSVHDPVEGILKPIGWSVEKKNTLDSFFG